jgi:hypothetical protein
MDCAQAKAQDMKDSHYYGHKSPVYGSPLTMIKSFEMSPSIELVLSFQPHGAPCAFEAAEAARQQLRRAVTGEFSSLSIANKDKQNGFLPGKPLRLAGFLSFR